MGCAALQKISVKAHSHTPQPFAHSRKAKTHATVVLGAHGEAIEEALTLLKRPTSGSATSMEFHGNGDVQMLDKPSANHHDATKADEASQEHNDAKKRRKPSRHDLLKDLARIASVMTPAKHCTTMRSVLSGWCEETCSDEKSAFAKAVGLETGTCDAKGFAFFLHEIAGGIFVKDGDNKFATVQSAGAYKPDMEADECNVHHLLNVKHGMCEELCIGADTVHDAEKRKLTQGTCNENGYVKFIGEKRMKAYSTIDSPEAKEVEAKEIAKEQEKREQQEVKQRLTRVRAAPKWEKRKRRQRKTL